MVQASEAVYFDIWGNQVSYDGIRYETPRRSLAGLNSAALNLKFIYSAAVEQMAALSLGLSQPAETLDRPANRRIERSRYRRPGERKAERRARRGY